jgi:N-acetylmuramoyl-L-alanine amidase
MNREPMKKESILRITFLVVAFLLMLSIPGPSYSEILEYRVVLDPGHGGISYRPIEKTGDRYDLLSGKYLDTFKEGTAFHNIYENIIMFQIGSKVKAILSKTETDEGFASFSKIVLKYSSNPVKRIKIKSFLSRPESMDRNAQMKLKDPNAGYRLFDYPGENGEIVNGRISYINSLKPNLVVSLHCASSTSRDRIGMNAVIVPPYKFFEKGLSLLQKKRTDTRFFYNSVYADWFEQNPSRSLFRWFLSDGFLYFSGYPLDKNNHPDFMKFRGYGRNMVHWIYSDPKGWAATASKHPSKSAYSNTIEGFIPQGAYWDRERSIYETYRRDGGIEGYGGDNLYSANEIIRFALLAVEKKGYRQADLRVAPPYMSSWVVPMYVNAISAYIELGYIKMPSYRHVLVEMQDDIAEGMAVGIYSLFAGLEIKESAFRFTPKGKKLDLERYKNKEGKSYFDMVVQ